MLIEQLINGLTLGSIYVVVALGYTLVFGVLNIVNMGHGEIFMFGAFMGVVVTNSLGLPLYVAFLIAIVVTAILGYFLERFALRPLRGKEGVSHLAPLISTIGVSIFLENAAHHLFGAGNKPIPDKLFGSEFYCWIYNGLLCANCNFRHRDSFDGRSDVLAF